MTLWAVFLGSLVGSAHCAAMCGLIAGAAGRRPTHAAAYHLSRLTGYLILGLIGGAAGAGAERLGTLAGLTGTATRIAGVSLAVFGVGVMLSAAGLRPLRWNPGHGWIGRVAARGRALPPLGRASVLGLVTAALPCGWLFAFVAAAAATADPVRGALTMAVFWTGTVPAVAGAGLMLARLAGPLRARLPLVSGAVLVGFGLYTALVRPGSGHAGHDAALPAAAPMHDHVAR
ncbi:MAG: sulfite exporter TauE/SafE family protein [Gemmatimonadales bacterium]